DAPPPRLGRRGPAGPRRRVGPGEGRRQAEEAGGPARARRRRAEDDLPARQGRDVQRHGTPAPESGQLLHARHTVLLGRVGGAQDSVAHGGHGPIGQAPEDAELHHEARPAAAVPRRRGGRPVRTPAVLVPLPRGPPAGLRPGNAPAGVRRAQRRPARRRPQGGVRRGLRARPGTPRHGQVGHGVVRGAPPRLEGEEGPPLELHAQRGGQPNVQAARRRDARDPDGRGGAAPLPRREDRAGVLLPPPGPARDRREPGGGAGEGRGRTLLLLRPGRRPPQRRPPPPGRLVGQDRRRLGPRGAAESPPRGTEVRRRDRRRGRPDQPAGRARRDHLGRLVRARRGPHAAPSPCRLRCGGERGCVDQDSRENLFRARLSPLPFARCFSGYGVSMLSHLAEGFPDSVAKLTLQYRMNEEICRLSNMIAYNGLLKCGNDQVRRQRLKLKHDSPRHSSQDGMWLEGAIDPDRPVVFLDTDSMPSSWQGPGYIGFKGLELNGAARGAGGPVNYSEAIVVQKLVTRLASHGVELSSIGVITPFRSQLRALNEDSTLKESTKQGLEICTIDRFQGRDKSVIVISLVRSNAEGKTGRLLQDFRRLNVAFSRAREKIIVVGSLMTLQKGSDVLRPLLHSLQQRGCVHKLAEDPNRNHNSYRAPP
ncbi:hypothetical protein THAOC_21129, partial [Thalassiosira oceanica]